jgi:hypothetical protein
MAPRKPDLHWIQNALDGLGEPPRDRDHGRGPERVDQAIRRTDRAQRRRTSRRPAGRLEPRKS